jgi:hypothetical protein
MVAGCGSKGAQNIVASHDDESTTSLPLRLDPIHAQFIQAKYETDYSISSPDEEGLPFVGDNHFTWTLSLELVDTAGSPSPEMAGSGAAVDPACNDPDEIGRAQLGDGDQYRWTELGDTFVWHHGDIGLNPGIPTYGCDHLLMGPSGHQGVVTVTVSRGTEECTATYDGTNSGVGPPARCTF